MKELPPPQEDNNTQGIGKVMVICAWVLGILMMTLFFSQWSKEKQMNTKAKLVSVNGVPETIIRRNVHNQYMVEGKINGKPVVFLLDTGATDVVIPGKVAKELNLIHGPEGIAGTAGGNITVNLTRIEELTIGNITIHRVSASINSKMDGDEVLLGMSALKRITFYQQGDNLVLTVTHKENKSTNDD
jgi:aspartyl protease family protein